MGDLAVIGLYLLAAGLTLIVVGLIVLFGPWAAVGSGAVLIVLGLLWPEGVTRAESVAAPPRGK